MYSRGLDKVFCFCCKLFKSDQNNNRSQLANEGFRHWKHLSDRLRSHETSNDHIINMTTWIDLQNRLKKMKQLINIFKKKLTRKKNIGKMYYKE